MTDLKAYSVLETDENTGGIVFASRKEQAIRKATARYFDGEEPETVCHRAPWADRHVDSGVPAALMIQHGWRFECSGCLRTIDEYMHDLHDEPDETTGGMYEGWTPEAVIGVQDSEIYCTDRCRQDHHTRQETRRRLQERAVKRFTRILLARLPDAEPVDNDRYGGRPYASFDEDSVVPLLQSVQVPFAYPDARHGYASLHYSPRGSRPDRRIYFMCPGGDVEAFNAYLDTHGKGDGHAR